MRLAGTPEQPVVVVIHPVEIEPPTIRVWVNGWNGGQVEKLRAAKRRTRSGR